MFVVHVHYSDPGLLYLPWIRLLLLFGSAVTEVRPAVTDHCYPLYIILIVMFYVLLLPLRKHIIYITILILQMQRG